MAQDPQRYLMVVWTEDNVIDIVQNGKNPFDLVPNVLLDYTGNHDDAKLMAKKIYNNLHPCDKYNSVLVPATIFNYEVPFTN